MNAEKRLRTFMSPVFFRSPANPTSDNEERTQPLLPLPDGARQECLVDDLLGGGIVIPRSVLQSAERERGERHPGVFLLLVGRPGSGKSTFALEFCYRLALRPNPDLGAIATEGLSSLYLSAESATSDVIAESQSYGWEQAETRIRAWSPESSFPQPTVFVVGREATLPRGVLNAADYFKTIRGHWDGLTMVGNYPPYVVVFDSLNVLPSEWNMETVLDALVNDCLRGPLLMLAVLDSHENSTLYDRWSHFADMTIELSYDKQERYLVRSVQVVKARHQDHADGEHRLKINPRPSRDEDVRHPMSPLIKEGGIFVFPSVHRTLSRARRRSRTRERRMELPLPTPFASFNKIIHKEGLPAGSCTAIVGSRGGMKSHLAYYTMLKFLETRQDERALLVSLRDEEDAAKQTLAEILSNQQNDECRPWAGIDDITEGHKRLNKHLDDDRLEILFFWPGYISPEEFFHLVQVSLDRCPSGRRPVSLVVVNGLEQLSARFPLCAQESMFVSGLITMLAVCGTTNIVVSGGDPSLPPDAGGVPAGLLQMGDLVIESSFQLIPKNWVWADEVWLTDRLTDELWRPVVREKQYQRDPAAQQDEPHVIYQINREPGARECRRRAVFYMGRQGDPQPLKEGSVVVRLLPDSFPYGKKF